MGPFTPGEHPHITPLRCWVERTFSDSTSHRPPLERSLRDLILRLARENPHWGYKRIVGELKASASASRQHRCARCCSKRVSGRRQSGRPPRGEGFLRAQAASVLACDFLTVETAFLQRIYVLFFISLATRRIKYVACCSNPDGRWAAQQARDLVMQLDDQQPFRFLIHDRDTKVSDPFGEVLRSEGIRVIRTPVQAPNANAYARTLDKQLDTHPPHRLPRSNPHPRPPPPRTCASHLPPPLQQTQTTPRARAPTTKWARTNPAERDRSPELPRPPRRTHPRIRGRLNLRTLRPFLVRFVIRHSLRTVTQTASGVAVTPVGRCGILMRVTPFVFGLMRHSAPSRGVVAQMLSAPAATLQTPAGT
jgi:hypothetical protein